MSGMTDLIETVRRMIARDPDPALCQCEEPWLDPDDDAAFCWRCRRPTERDEDDE